VGFRLWIKRGTFRATGRQELEMAGELKSHLVLLDMVLLDTPVTILIYL